MRLVKGKPDTFNKKLDKEITALLKFIDKTAKEVNRWPAWMKGKADPKVDRKRRRVVK